MMRLVGAACLSLGGAATGFGLARQVRQTQRQVDVLVDALGQLENELQYRLLPTARLLDLLATRTDGPVGRLFRRAADAMDRDPTLPALQAIRRSLDGSECLGERGTETLLELAAALGRYDLEGQCRAIRAARARLAAQSAALEQDRAARCRTYGALGVCTGLAAAIVLV
jgi:stage III sporulation protein AB